MEKKYDIIVFGGSGFTGEYVVREMLATSDIESKTWAIAGRSKEKLSTTLQSLAKELSVTDKQVDIIEANVNDQDSLEKMCSKCHCLINCVGPYFLWGRQVVEACIKNKTHYLDISGEPLFMEEVARDYNGDACEAGVVVVSACGFDSIPVDIGVRYCQKKFNGTLTALESYMNAQVGEKGFSVHFPTFQCVVNGFANQSKLKKFRKSLNLPRLPYVGPRLPSMTTLKYHKHFKKYYVPFAGSDRSVALRSQRSLCEKTGDNHTPAQVGVYMTFQSTALLVYLSLFGVVFIMLVSTRFGRYLLLKYPEVCTFGLVTRRGATREQIAQSSFSFNFLGAGYSDVAGASDGKLPDRFIEAQVTGPDPGYISCSIFIVQAAYAVLNKEDIQGGVVTPSVALENTDYVDRLAARGIEFKVKYEGPDLQFPSIF